MPKYVLGAGISGLIWQFYNPEMILVGEEIGGQLKSEFSLGPRYLEVDKYSEKLLDDLKMKKIKRKIKVGYHYNGEVHDCISENLMKTYYKKSRGKENTKDEIFLNNKQKNFEVFEIDFAKVITKLKDNGGSHKDKNVNRIRVKDQKISIGRKDFLFKKLVSTIPKNIFYKLCNIEKEFYFKPVTFALLNVKIKEGYDFVYYPEKDIPFYRMSETDKGYVVAEILGEHNIIELTEMFGNELLDFKILPNSQIEKENFKEDFANVTFSGRYGNWDRTYKINKVIKEAIEYEN